LGTLMGALLMQLIAATVIQHNLPDSLARMIQAGIIVVAVYVQRDRGGS
jgi:galactofuranose transport system permease protein